MSDVANPININQDWSVSERPTFVSYPQSKTINVSQSVIFYCEATGDPQPTVSWKINVSVLPEIMTG